MVALTHNGETPLEQPAPRAIPWEGQFMPAISPTIKSYIAGFLDGDGCILFQLIRRADCIYGYQIRASIVFFQKTKNRKHLELLKTYLRCGTIRNRNDGMSELAIVGISAVIEILKLLKPYILLKKQQVKLAFKIASIMREKVTVSKFVKAAHLVDEFGKLNYSKKRTNTSAKLKKYLRRKKLYPCND